MIKYKYVDWKGLIKIDMKGDGIWNDIRHIQTKKMVLEHSSSRGVNEECGFVYLMKVRLLNWRYDVRSWHNDSVPVMWE